MRNFTIFCVRILVIVIMIIVIGSMFLHSCSIGTKKPTYCPDDNEYCNIIWISDYGFMTSYCGNMEFYGTIEGDEKSYPFYGYHLWNQGGDSKKYIEFSSFDSWQYEQFSGEYMGHAKITYKWNDKMVLNIRDNEYITDESIPDKIVFKKYNKSDVNLESLGFDLSFLSEPESE